MLLKKSGFYAEERSMCLRLRGGGERSHIPAGDRRWHNVSGNILAMQSVDT